MRSSETIHARLVVRGVYGEGRHHLDYRYQLTATAQLYTLGGNPEPHFSLTGEGRTLYRNGGVGAWAFGGCCHDQCVTVWSRLHAVEMVHLANHRGEPMHAAANAYHWAGLGRYGERKPALLRSHLRLDQDAATSLDAYCGPLGELARSHPSRKVREAVEGMGKAQVDAVVRHQRALWLDQAREAIAVILDAVPPAGVEVIERTADRDWLARAGLLP